MDAESSDLQIIPFIHILSDDMKLDATIGNAIITGLPRELDFKFRFSLVNLISRK